MVKKVTINITPKDPGLPRQSQRIYVNTRVKKLMGTWHPGYNPQVHKSKYLHGSVMMACGYRKWIVRWDDGHNWNQMYTGNGYHSAGLKICEDEDIQGFSDALSSPTRKNESKTNFNDNINKLKSFVGRL